MGRIVNREVVGFRCELRSCSASERSTRSYPASTTWIDFALELQSLVTIGWSFVLHPQMRAYCPTHAGRAWDCSCQTNPERAHLCTAHVPEAASLVWDASSIPVIAVKVLEFAA